MKNIIASLIPGAKAVAAAAIAGALAYLGAHATGVSTDLVDGDWEALEAVAVAAALAAYTAGGRAARAILDKLFPPPKP
ncbi:MAG: hypothetical protein OXG44_17410 [Gammaproteobacteria bacterium]|nr:hypothetical protein [Gammaproteobacteria bacterium]